MPKESRETGTRKWRGEGLQGGRCRSALYPQHGILGFGVTVCIEHLWFQEVSAALPSSPWRNIHFGNTFFMNPRTVNPLANDTLCWNHVRKEIHRAHRDPRCAAFMFRRVPVTNFPRDRTTVPAENTTQRPVNAIGSHGENSNAHSSARRAAITTTASIQN